jgi:glycosyltransferase involved in cell wall biosynthesis
VNIYLDNVNFSSSSGPNSFARKLAKELISLGHKIDEKDASQIDVVLTFIMSSLNTKFKPMAQRLDGIYFNIAQDYKSLNSPIRMTYEMSDAVIFQSEFNKLLTEKYFGKHDNSHVIRNGTNFEEIEKILPLKHRIIDQFEEVWSCASSWRPHKRLSENIRYFLEHASDKTCLVIAGSNPDFNINHPRIFYVGPLDWMTLISLYKRSSKFLHLAWLDHCPNVVIDAASCGCQIVCTTAGGTKEISGKDSIVIEEAEWDFEPIRLYHPPDLDFTKVSSIESKEVDLNIVTATRNYLNVLEKIKQ